MSEIRAFLETIDDEYLIGLSNKGIVKRSHKDLETAGIQIEEEGEEIRGQYQEARVTLRLPLTDSTCSCPSTGICKHVIMTILAAQKDSGEQASEAKAAGAENQAPEDGGEENRTPRDGGESPEESGLADRISEVPAEQLKKALTGKEWIRLLTQTDFAEDFQVEKGRMITVRNIRSDTTVKLSWPLKLSTCSACHDDKLCVHKAGAILACQIQAGTIRLEELLDAEAEQTEEFDEGSVPEVLADLKTFLEELLMIGSARLSPEVPLGLERMALRAHNAKLPGLEDQLRALSESVAGYQGRMARITAGDLMRRITEVYQLQKQMLKLLSQGKNVYALAGTFRSEYEDVPELTLHGVGMREFESSSGFAGKTIYFFEERTKSFYTYTMARPTFYEKGAGRRAAEESVPWGLNCTLAQLSKAKVVLRGGKANMGKRLSSTSKARADLITLGGALPDSIAEKIHDDYEELWKARLERLNESGEELPEADKLYFIRARSLLDMHYDEILQKLIFWFEDQEGRRLRGELAYSRHEEMAIKSLEKMEKRQKSGEELPVFLGALYVEDGECSFYPIETIGAERLGEA